MSRCYLSRMDVVGYSNIYRSNPQGVNDALEPIIQRLDSELSGYNRTTGTDNGLRFHQMYGDTLDISFETGSNDEVRFLALLDVTCMVQEQLMMKGRMVRGAIVCDDLIDSELVFTGMAMVEAARLEKKTKSPHLILGDDTIDMLRRSTGILFPNEKDRTAYIDSTLYERNKLDCFRHPSRVIPYEAQITGDSVRACIDRIERVSRNNTPDGESLRSADTMLNGLRRYCQECFPDTVTS